MSILSRSADLVYTFRFLRLLTTDWEDMKAYELGIIDENGKRIRSKRVQTPEEKAAYNTFHRLVFSLKRLLNKAPGGRSRIASYAAALFLLKEHSGMTDKGLEKLLERLDVDMSSIIEETSTWFVVEDEQGVSVLAPGIYRLKEDKLINKFYEPLAFKNDRIRVHENCRPSGQVFGINIYEVSHENTGQAVYVTPEDLIK